MSKKTLNHANLEALGAAQLATLLLEVSAGSADLKRRLRLELSHSLGSGELALEVRKRLVALRKSKSYVGWRKRKALIKDLTTQLAMITDKIAPDDPTEAYDVLWQFVELAPFIFARVDDSKGDVGAVFHDALAHFKDIAPRAVIAPDALADRIWTVLQDDADGVWDGIIPLMAPTLGTDGLARLRDRVETYAAQPETSGSDDHDAIQFLRQLRGGDSYVANKKARFVKECLQQIATAAGDHDAYVAQYSKADLARKDIAAEVAMLWLANGQTGTALDLLLNADDHPASAQDAWDAAYIACLTAQGHVGDAQDHRWACFAETLDPAHLRDYLKQLPDFDDVEAEDRAKQHVLAFPDALAALGFCLKWPDLLTAARLVTTRADDINGVHAAVLAPAADALRARYPLAATILLRAMVNDTLVYGRPGRYADAAAHLNDCADLDAQISDYDVYPDHARYIAMLRTRFESKTTFWTKLRDNKASKSVRKTP